VEVIQRLRRGEEPERQLAVLHDLCEALELGSLCALGGLTPMPVRSALQHFAEDFHPAPEGVAR
jgi:formate dehydrogenase iron-sulfur subunit